MLQSEDTKFQSIEQLIHLPELIPIPAQQYPFKRIEDKNNLIKSTIKEFGNNLVQQINSSFFIFSKPENFQFKFPQSLFPPVPPGQRNQITYEQKIITEQQNTFKDKLSEVQLNQIAENGQFKVKSNIQYITLPYVWKINQRLFWGKIKIQRVWNQALAKVYGLFYDSLQNLKATIPRQLSKIKRLPIRLFSLLFGKKSLQIAVDVNYQKQLYLDFWKNLFQNNYSDKSEWGAALWNYLYVEFNPIIYEVISQQQFKNKFERDKERKRREAIKQKYYQACSASNEKKQKILAVHQEFTKEWTKLKKKVFNEISSQLNSIDDSSNNKTQSEEELLLQNKQNAKDEKIIELIAQKKFTLYLDYMEKQLPNQNIPDDVVKAILLILKIFRLISLKEDKRRKTESLRRKKIENEIKKKFPIKSLHFSFFNTLLESQMIKISKALKQQMYIELKKDPQFREKLSHQQIKAYDSFIYYREKHETLLQAKKNQIKVLYEPVRVFVSNYLLFPPYQVYRESNYYYLKKVSDNITIDTSKNFWKFKLYFMRIKTWTINTLVFKLYHVWKGPLGLRCLFGVQDFQYSMEIDYQTGRIYYLTRRTVIGTFKKVLEGIKLSRQKFENTPDLGLFGKNASRIVNYMECYLFRFLFVGVLISLIGYPLLILVSSIVVTALALTFWAWMPIILLVNYLFNILIYQFQSSYRPQKLLPRFLPLLILVIGFIKPILTICFKVFRLVVLVPILSLFILLFAIIQRGFRLLADSIMFFLFKKIGRTPSRDTAIARKISGPGMSKSYYMSITEQDVYVLIRSQLEQIFLSKFNEIILQKINKNFLNFQTVLKLVLKPFNVDYYENGIMKFNTDKLRNEYYKQYQIYIARYPRNPYNVRFTQEEIDNYFENTVKIVQQFVQTHKIQKWIFHDFQLYEDMYDELTRAIWIRCFNCGELIFEPLQKLDMRFKLEDQYNEDEGINIKMRKNVGSIMKALEGQVKLSHERQTLAPFKHNLLNQQISIELIDRVFQIQAGNSIQTVYLDADNIQTLFVPNLNIKEIIVANSQLRQRQIKSHPNIIHF